MIKTHFYQLCVKDRIFSFLKSRYVSFWRRFCYRSSLIRKIGHSPIQYFSQFSLRRYYFLPKSITSPTSLTNPQRSQPPFTIPMHRPNHIPSLAHHSLFIIASAPNTNAHCSPPRTNLSTNRSHQIENDPDNRDKRLLQPNREISNPIFPPPTLLSSRIARICPTCINFIYKHNFRISYSKSLETRFEKRSRSRKKLEFHTEPATTFPFKRRVRS